MRTFQQFLDSPKSGKDSLASFSLQHFDICDLVKNRSLITCDTNSKFLAAELDKIKFPGVFSFEVDSPSSESTLLNYDINIDEKINEESIDILNPSLIKPVRSLLKIKKKVQFCPQSAWYGLDGKKQTKPLSNKYTLQYSLLKQSFSPCI